MKALPEIMPGNQQVQMTTTFLGYNHNQIIQDGEMYDMKNLGGEQYPLLALRKRRGVLSMDPEGNTPVKLNGIHGRDQLVFVRGSQVFYNLYPVSGITLSTAENMNPKTIVSFGAYVCIWPDKKYFNTADLTDVGSMERLYETSGENVSLIMCRADGTNYDMTQITVSNTAPENPAGGDLWIDQSGDVDVLRQWTASTGEWTEVPTTYVKISAAGIGSGLKEYDVVNLSGLEAMNGVTSKVAAQVEALNGSMIVYGAGDGYIIVAGLLSASQLALKDQNVYANLTIPDMDWIVESNNRLWGCKYGLSGGEVVNEIRCTALGDFRNWNRFMGNSQDSYVASVGTDGPFTGAITQRGYPVFFKENCIHRVSGTTPSSFTIQTTMARGVQKGSGKSLAVVSENIYYKARNAVMMYDGNMPQPISTQLGEILYSDARAGALGAKYYISMKDANNNWTQFVYDTEKGIWHKEDALRALGYGAVDDELYLIDEEHNTLVSVNGTQMGITGSEGAMESEVPWSATFGLFGTDYRGQKYLSRFDIRIYIEPNHEAKLEIQYDNSNEWISQGRIRGKNLGTVMIPVRPRRCDTLRFRISGTGEVRIYSISRLMEVGGDG